MKIWKVLITITLRKEGKGNYIIINSYRLITLLNIIGKLLEIIIVYKILELAETNNLLLKTQIGIKKSKLIKIIFYLLIKQIYII